MGAVQSGKISEEHDARLADLNAGIAQQVQCSQSLKVKFASISQDTSTIGPEMAHSRKCLEEHDARFLELGSHVADKEQSGKISEEHDARLADLNARIAQ